MSPTDPLIIRSVGELQRWSDEQRAAGRRVGLVPTMGGLHEGHLSLVRLAARHAQRVIVSIFVNPTQFGPGEDLESYPRDLEGDVARLRPHGVDVVFAPEVEDIYPEGAPSWVEVDESLTGGLCGRHRPGHFRGVTTVVARLFHAAKPHIAVFGEKDYQQLVIVGHMTRALRFDVEIVPGPTVREPDGLAMSSRNVYLSADARGQARVLNAALHQARRLVSDGELDARYLAGIVRDDIEKQPLARVQYVEIVHPETLAPVDQIEGEAVLAVAVLFEGTRLIDNTLLETT